MKRGRYPMRLRVTAPGHEGFIHIRGEEPGGYLVAHDFSAPGGWWIYDVWVLDADAIERLTGFRPEPRQSPSVDCPDPPR